MHKKLVRRRLAVAFVFFVFLTLMTFAQERDRSKIPDQYKWDLTAIYPSDQAWRAAKDQFVAELPKVRELQGTLASSPKHLADVLELSSHLEKELNRLFVYAGLISDQDTRVSAYQAMKQEMLQLGAKFAAETAFIEPEILKIDKATIDRFVAEEPRLKVYRQYLDDIQRRRAHTLDDAEEKLLAGAGVMAGGPASVFGIFADADFPYPTVVLSDGKSVKLDKAAFSCIGRVHLGRIARKLWRLFLAPLAPTAGPTGHY
jgi:oligoendopeptidase F